jgi:PiT family inorganic phosphate transporter
VIGEGLISKVIIPAVLAPVVAIAIATAGTFAVYALTDRVSEQVRDRGFARERVPA